MTPTTPKDFARQHIAADTAYKKALADRVAAQRSGDDAAFDIAFAAEQSALDARYGSYCVACRELGLEFAGLDTDEKIRAAAEAPDAPVECDLTEVFAGDPRRAFLSQETGRWTQDVTFAALDRVYAVEISRVVEGILPETSTDHGHNDVWADRGAALERARSLAAELAARYAAAYGGESSVTERDDGAMFAAECHDGSEYDGSRVAGTVRVVMVGAPLVRVGTVVRHHEGHPGCVVAVHYEYPLPPESAKVFGPARARRVRHIGPVWRSTAPGQRQQYWSTETDARATGDAVDQPERRPLVGTEESAYAKAFINPDLRGVCAEVWDDDPKPIAPDLSGYED